MSGGGKQVSVVVIGAGPSGLAIGQQLSQRGVTYRILERDVIGGSWCRMAEELHLVSPFWTNTLPGSSFPLTRPYEKLRALQYYDYLKDYARRFGLAVTEGAEVLSIGIGTESPFVVSTAQHEWHAQCVICASGYYGNPQYAEMPDGDDGSVPRLHAKEFHSVCQVSAQYGQGAQILIIGKRVTAGQLMVELADAGFAVTLAIRSPLKIRPGHSFARAKEAAYFVYEEAFVRCVPNVRGNSYPPMDGGHSEVLIRDGTVKTCGPLRAIFDGRVKLMNGERRDCDLIIHATGYQPHLPYLTGAELEGFAEMRGMQSARIPGLYFIGFDNLRNFRSRYLRGIRDDARWLAREITKVVSRSGRSSEMDKATPT